jgi:hypothetical protein
MKQRRSRYDVTNTVNLHDVTSTGSAVIETLTNTINGLDTSIIERAFDDCHSLFVGEYPKYRPCDTLYHDLQHTFDVTLAFTRLLDGYQRIASTDQRIDPECALVGVITALFHDAGYIRREDDQQHNNGAEYTLIHVSRGAEFLKRYLHKLNLGEYAQVAANLVHYTGYELGPEDIHLPDAKTHHLGHMLGTADLIAQMSDRCYLEKCRDRLYPEFVLGGIAIQLDENGKEKIIYSSGEDLLRKTPAFYTGELDHRLNSMFNKAYNYEIAHFDGERKYVNALGQNQALLKKVLKENNFSLLRRRPPANYGTRNFPGLEAYLDRYPLQHRKFG